MVSVEANFVGKTDWTLNPDHNGSYKDMMVKIVNLCDQKDQEKCEDFWMHK